MAKSLVSHVMDLNKSGVTFTDSLFADLGASAVTFRELKEDLGHDFFTQEDLIIRTASGGGGTLLVETTDYVLSEEDTLLSSEVTTAVGATRHVYKKIQIINASYQTGDLYISGKWVADGIDMSFYNCISPIFTTKAAAYTITDTDYYKHYLVTTGTATKTITLPTVADNKHLRIKITKADTGYGPVLVDGEGSETINGLTHIFLWAQYDCIEIMSTGSEWIIINEFKPYFYSGWINRSDWTNAHIGFATITYDNPSTADPFVIGDKVLGANGSYGICIYHSAATLVIANCVTVGATVFANNEALSGDLSSATALVDMAAGLKNIDSNIYHGLGKNLRQFNLKFIMSTDASENNSMDMVNAVFDSQASPSQQYNIAYYQVDTNNVKLQCGASGILKVKDDGTVDTLNTQDYYYNIFIKLLN